MHSRRRSSTPMPAAADKPIADAMPPTEAGPVWAFERFKEVSRFSKDKSDS